jgi:hypothetical protein
LNATPSTSSESYRAVRLWRETSEAKSTQRGRKQANKVRPGSYLQGATLHLLHANHVKGKMLVQHHDGVHNELGEKVLLVRNKLRRETDTLLKRKADTHAHTSHFRNILTHTPVILETY